MTNENGKYFVKEEAQRRWDEYRQRVADAKPEEKIVFCGTVFEEDPKGECFYNVIFHSDVDFSGSTFLHSTVFSNAVFERDAIFENCKFPTGAIFVFTEFHGDAEFESIISDEKLRFAAVTFKQNANFSRATFNDIAVFESEECPPDSEHKKTEFGYFANFDKCIWKDYVRFSDVTFRDDACFNNGTFEYEIYFDNCAVTGSTNFEDASFLEYSGRKEKRRNRARFLYNSFDGKVSFWNARFNCPVKFIDNHFEDQAEFRKAIFNKMAIFDRKNYFHSRLFLDRSYKSFSRAQDATEPYRIAKQTAHQAGDSRMEGIYHFQEQCSANKTERQNVSLEYMLKHPWAGTRKFLGAWGEYFLGNWVYGYGERPQRILLTAIAVIIVYAGLFFGFTGINYGSLPVKKLIPVGSKQLSFQAAANTPINCQTVELPPKDLTYAGNCLYFSVVTFTTLGYGDFQPYPKMRWLSATEAALGAALMAMFIVSLSRKFVR